jgi:hypothetical protein
MITSEEKIVKSIFVCAVAALCACTAGKTQSSATPQLWFFLHSYLSNTSAVQLAESRIDQAAAAGYTGVVMWDSGINYLHDSWWNPSYMRQAVQYARGKGLSVMPLVAPYGHSYDELTQNPNLAEGERVLGTQFKVDAAGKTLQVVNSFPGLQNGGFESGQTGWFGYGDPGASVDETTSHTGLASVLIRNAPGNCRLSQSFTVLPWRQYHMRMFYQTQGFSGSPQVLIFGDGNLAYTRVNQGLSLSSAQGWTEWDYTFNSGPHTTMEILMGVWGGSQGSLWFDDISLEETGLVYVLRGNSTPLSVYDPNNPTHVFREGADFGTVSDPQLSGPVPYFQDYWHQPVTVPVPSGSSLQAGQTVAMNWYAIQPEAGDAGVSLTDPSALAWRSQNAAAVASMFSASTGFFFNYDEMRHMNSTASAKAMNMTPAQLLDWHFNQTYQLYRSLNPASTIYVWNDMFDPNHNAVNNYYLVEGDLTGSWTGLPSDVVIMNWNLGQLKTSATWFATPPNAHRQIVAGYYDSGNGTAAASTELPQVAGVPGILGMMYTTWADDYTQLANFANAARAAWPAYLASLPAAGPSVTSFKVLYGSENYNVIGSNRARLPWQIHGIQVTFSEPIAHGNAGSLAGVAATGFTGLGTNTLTWTFNPISQASFTTFLAGGGANALTDSSGHGIGNGQGFTQALNILWGDFNGDGIINDADVNGVLAIARGSAYNAFADTNGDGKVNALDIGIVESRLGLTLAQASRPAQ